MDKETYDLIIIGGGPAGLTAGIYAQRAGIKTVLLEKELPGGQVNEAPTIENYPGFQTISGMELGNKMKEHALSFDLPIESQGVQSLKVDGDVKIVKTDVSELKAKTVIISTGAKPKRLDIKGEQKFLGRGVSYCGTCDGPFFKDKVVAAIGGGDRALKEALFLANITKKVYLIHRRDEFRGENINVERLKKKDNVEFILNTVVEEIKGDVKVSALNLKDIKKGITKDLPVEGTFIFVGVVPRNEFIEADKDEHGFLITKLNLETSMSGVFAAGDCRSKNWRQVATAVGEGAQSLSSVEDYLHNLS